MSAENEKGSSRDAEIVRLIEETHTAIANTRRFLDELSTSEILSRERVQSFVKDLEQRLKRLQERG